MEIKRAAELLRGLADGRDPITGARLPDESVYNHPEIIRALHCVLQELQTRQTVAQAVNAGRSWRPDEEQKLLEEYDAENDAELAPTAEALARAYGDVRAAAEQLHQHPNTVRYRLRRAKAVLGMPDAPDREFAFLLGLIFLDRTNPLLGR